MRFEEVLRDLSAFATSLGMAFARGDDTPRPLTEFDPAGPASRELVLTGPGHVIIARGEQQAVNVDTGAGWFFCLDDGRLTLTSEPAAEALQLTLPSLRKLVVAGSGRVECARLDRDGEVSVAGSGRAEVALADGGDVAINVAGSGRVTVDGTADSLVLSIAGSGSCDGEGLLASKAAVNIAGSGSAIFACHGDVVANLMGSGNVIVLGDARCNVRSAGSGTLTCERPPAAA